LRAARRDEDTMDADVGYLLVAEFFHAVRINLLED